MSVINSITTIAMDHRILVRMQYELQQEDYFSDYSIVVTNPCMPTAADSYQNVRGNYSKHSVIAAVISNKLIDITALMGVKLTDIRID